MKMQGELYDAHSEGETGNEAHLDLGSDFGSSD